MEINRLILGDNLEIMRQMASESIDLIYLDPPFFSNRNYEVIWGDRGEIRSFEDRWAGGIDHYIGWLKERVQEMYRLLKPTGAIFLHCDWHASAYIRVYILDKLFGGENFRNQIAWKRQPPRGAKATSKQFARSSDDILFYTKGKGYIWNPPYKPYSENFIAEKFRPDENGRLFRDCDLGDYSPASIKAFEQQNKIYVTSSGKKRLKRYLDEEKGEAVSDIWIDIAEVNSMAKERIGYPTQKPEKLLERIILTASKEGDVVFDPFVGGGTTIVVADKLGRRWIGIDQSVQAVKVSELRIYNARTLFSAPFVVNLHKYDYDTLRYKDAFEFEAWIVQQYGGSSNAKQRGDLGIDGRTKEGIPIQVKRSDNIGRNVIDNFRSACERFDDSLFHKNKESGRSVGVLIAFSFGKGAIEEVARLKLQHNLVIRLVRVDEIVPIAKKPKLTVSLKDLGADEKGQREIEFTAQAESEAGIEMYAWDWDYDERTKLFKPEVLRDMTGIQKHKFKPGAYVIGVKVVDNDGLETDEILRLKINGGVKRE